MKTVSPTMAAVDSKSSLKVTFHKTSSLSGSTALTTPVCIGLPRKIGQSAWAEAASRMIEVQSRIFFMTGYHFYGCGRSFVLRMP